VGGLRFVRRWSAVRSAVVCGFQTYPKYWQDKRSPINHPDVGCTRGNMARVIVNAEQTRNLQRAVSSARPRSSDCQRDNMQYSMHALPATDGRS